MLTKTMTFLTLCSIIFAAEVGADPIALGEIKNGAFTDQLEYTVEIYLKSQTGTVAGATDFNLGDTTLAIDFNGTTFTGLPTLSEENTLFSTVDYNAMSVTSIAGGIVGLVIDLKASASGGGVQLPTTEVLIAKMTFAVNNAAGQADISGNSAQSSLRDSDNAIGGIGWVTGTDTRIMTCLPDIEGTPAASVIVGNTFSFIPTVVDTCGASTYSVAGLPGWATFSTTTGELSGTLVAGDVGTYGNIEITVTDPAGSDVTGIFAITVSDVPGGSGSSGGCFIGSLVR